MGRTRSLMTTHRCCRRRRAPPAGLAQPRRVCGAPDHAGRQSVGRLPAVGQGPRSAGGACCGMQHCCPGHRRLPRSTPSRSRNPDHLQQLTGPLRVRRLPPHGHCSSAGRRAVLSGPIATPPNLHRPCHCQTLGPSWYLWQGWGWVCREGYSPLYDSWTNCNFPRPCSGKIQVGAHWQLEGSPIGWSSTGCLARLPLRMDLAPAGLLRGLHLDPDPRNCCRRRSAEKRGEPQPALEERRVRRRPRPRQAKIPKLGWCFGWQAVRDPTHVARRRQRHRVPRCPRSPRGTAKLQDGGALPDVPGAPQ
jgi:hypothetical protein